MPPDLRPRADPPGPPAGLGEPSVLL